MTAPSRPPERNPGLKGMPLRNILLFAGLVLIGNAPLWISLDLLMPVREWTAVMSAFLIRLSGIEVIRKSCFLFFEQKRWVITPECTALSALIVFTAFIIAYPSGLRAKGIALALGLPFLVAVNLLRILSLAWLSRWFPGSAEFVHDYMWQVAFLILIAVLWLLWIEIVVNHEERAAFSA